MSCERKIKAVVFDMDGVIFDTEKMYLDAWKTIGDKYGIDRADESALMCVGLSQTDSVKLLLERYGADFQVEKYHKEIRRLVEDKMSDEGIPMKKGVCEILNFIRECKIPLGLASSTQKNRVESLLSKAGIKDYFQVIVGGDMIEHSKPDPLIYLLACEKLDVDPHDSVAVEDSRNGVISAYRAGMRTLLVPDLIQPDEEMMKMSEGRFEDLIDVKKYLEAVM
ncbi:MAG: HAD family hydrolase [Oscillospiraceae bacterium]